MSYSQKRVSAVEGQESKFGKVNAVNATSSMQGCSCLCDGQQVVCDRVDSIGNIGNGRKRHHNEMT